MRKLPMAVALLLLGGAGRAAAECTAGATTLCLNASRFQVEVSWRDSHDRTGVGQAASITADTGYFWFFSEANIELVVKVLDARSVNQKFWVFFGALSSVEYDLAVTDTVTGAVKTYHNPLGQFASVGDTGAFDPASPAPEREIVNAAGSAISPASLESVQAFIEAPASGASSVFAPCPDSPYGFKLNGCRFHLAVEWKDSHGREGVGQPVQLTNDTGYFWFFSPTNVELVVKVLDARTVNGKLWVFFGALSNVEYALTVTDTVTGNVRRYENSAGRFASVGDTDAFRAGRSVSPVRDATGAASADVGPDGGILTAMGSDGSRFTLEVPVDAVNVPTTITMTPVSRIDRIPFSGGLVAGVEFEPQGLRLLVPATLTIHPASPAAVDRTLTYAYLAGGEDFILYPRTADASSLSISVPHFSGYGAGEGTSDDAAQQASQPAASPLAPYIQEIAQWQKMEFEDQITNDEFQEKLEDVVHRAYLEQIAPALQEAKRSCDRAQVKVAITTALEFSMLIQKWGSDESLVLNGITSEILADCVEILENCQKRAFDRCVARNDPYEAAVILDIGRQLQLLGVDFPPFLTEDGYVESCLRFELDFESKLVDHVEVGGYDYTRRVKFRSAQLPLRIQFTTNPYVRGNTAWDGACTLVNELATMEYNRKPCTVACTADNGYAVVFALTLEGLSSWDPSSVQVVMLYDPGAPAVRGTETCPVGSPSEFEFFPTFAGQYHLLHENENETGEVDFYVAKDWDLLRTTAGPSQNGAYFAKKSYERSVARNAVETITEETHLFLRHTPKKEMPACP